MAKSGLSEKAELAIYSIGVAIIIGGIPVVASNFLSVPSERILLFSNYFVSSSLTATLIYLYSKLVDLTKDQNTQQENVVDIQSQQAEIMEYQKEIAMSDRDPQLSLSVDRLSPEGDIIGELRNSGEGIALDPHLEVKESHHQAEGRRQLYKARPVSEDQKASPAYLKGAERKPVRFEIGGESVPEEWKRDDNADEIKLDYSLEYDTVSGETLNRFFFTGMTDRSSLADRLANRANNDRSRNNS